MRDTGGRGLLYEGRGCLSGILNKTPKGDHSEHGPTFFTPERDHFIYIKYIYFYISLRATLNETSTAKYNGVLPRTP